MSSAAITLKKVNKIYGEGEASLHVLKDVDLDVADGEFVAITGPSGSGKSTLLNILGCLDRPTSGEFCLESHDVSDYSDDKLSTIRNEQLGFIFQSFNLVPQLTVLENVEVPVLYSSVSTLEGRQRAKELLDAVGLSERLDHKPAQLSGGERQRVAIARSLVNDPLFILADEPTGNLDSKTGQEVLRILVELHEEGRTIIMITHDHNISALAQREVRLMDGPIESANGS